MDTIHQARSLAPDSTAQARPIYFHTMSLGLLIFLPIACFTMLAVFITLLFHRLAILCWIFVVLSVGMSIMFMVVRQSREGPKYWFNLGAVCFVATCFGFALGLWNYHRNMIIYWAYDGQREYSNVLPTTPAVQYLDAGQMSFSAGTVLDLDRVITYHTGTGGATYCLAPVVSGPAQSSSRQQTVIEFWAAGLNCCEVNNFHCGPLEARGGLVHLSDPSLPDNHLTDFRQAALVGSAAHGLTSSEDALFLQWTPDPAQAQATYYRSGITVMASGIVIYSVISVVAGFMLHFIRRLPSRSVMKDKLTARAYSETLSPKYT